MNDSLNELKQRLSRKYLGKGGIHGLGIRRAQNAISVYVTPDASPEQETLLQGLREDAAPIKIIIIEENPPKVAGC